MRWVFAAVAALVLGLGGVPLAAANPAPTNPLCYNSPAYRNTHEQECLITASATAQPVGHGGGGNPGLLGGLLHTLSGGLL